MSLWGRIFGRERRDAGTIRASDPYLAEYFQLPAASHVNVRQASGISVAYASVSAIALALASVPLNTYRRTEGGGREKALEHPLYGVLHDTASAAVSAFEFREHLIASLLIDGNAYALAEWSGRGQVTALRPLDPRAVAVEQLDSGRLRYRVTDRRGRAAVHVQDEILHIRHRLGPDGVMGQSPVQMARETFALGLTQAETAQKQAQRSHRAEGALIFPQKINVDEKHRVLSRLGDKFGSDMSAEGGVLVLDGGAEWRPLAFSSRDAEFLEHRKLTDLAIARIFGVPPTTVGIVEHATFSNADQEARAFVMRCLAPMARRVEQAMNMALLPPSSRKSLFVEHDLAGLLRGDLKARFESYRIGREWGWLSVNEIRQMENMPRVEGGDERLSPLNMQALDQRDGDVPE